MTAILAVKQFLTYVNGAPFQPAIAVGLGLPDDVFAGIARSLEMRKDRLRAGLSDAGFSCSDPAGGYFVIADAAPLGASDAVAFCRELPDRAGVVGVPVSAFVRSSRPELHSLVRFAFCKRPEVLDAAVERLAALR